MRYGLRVVPTAERQIRSASAWWAQNRPGAPALFREELKSAFDFITSQPLAAALAPNVQARDIRRFNLSRIHYHLYYRVRGQVVEVLAVWHMSRGSGPNV